MDNVRELMLIKRNYMIEVENTEGIAAAKAQGNEQRKTDRERHKQALMLQKQKKDDALKLQKQQAVGASKLQIQQKFIDLEMQQMRQNIGIVLEDSENATLAAKDAQEIKEIEYAKKIQKETALHIEDMKMKNSKTLINYAIICLIISLVCLFFFFLGLRVLLGAYF